MKKHENDIEYLSVADYFWSSDFPLCAALAMNHPIVAENRMDPHRVEFIFKRNQDVEETIKRYWRNELLVDPQRYWETQRRLKSRLWGTMGNENENKHERDIK